MKIIMEQQNRKFQFRAWVPAIETMLQGVALYPSGMIGMTDEEFKSQLNPKYEFDGEEVRVKVSEDGESGGEFVTTVMTGDEYIWFDYDEVIVMQWTGFVTEDDTEIYEGDLISYTWKADTETNPDLHFVEPITYEFGMFSVEAAPLYAAIDISEEAHKIIGNIYQNPEMLPAIK